MKLPADINTFCPNRTSDPYWNESAWFSFSAPERGIHGFLYYFFRPNMNLLVGGPAMWDSSGSTMWDILYCDWPTLQAMPADAEKFGFTAQNSLSVELLEPSQLFRLHYDNNGFTLNLEWTAIAEPHDFTAMEELATGATGERLHIEQCGRVKGTIRHHQEVYQIDCYSIRDTSFGVRKFTTVSKGSYFWGIASEDFAFHALTLGEGREQQVVGGFLMQDGRTEGLKGGTRRVIEDGRYTPRTFAVDLEDRAGRKVSMTATTSSDFIFAGYPDNPTTWSLLEIEEGGRRFWGDIQEFRPIEQFRRQVRGGLASSEDGK